MTWDNLSTDGMIVSEAPTSDVLMSWELLRPLWPRPRPRVITLSCRHRELQAPSSGQGCWQLLAISLSDLGIMSGQVRERQWPPHPDGERRAYWQVGSPPLNPHRLNVTSGWPDLYLPADLVTLLISFWERSSFLDRRFQCGSHVWCTVIILD